MGVAATTDWYCRRIVEICNGFLVQAYRRNLSSCAFTWHPNASRLQSSRIAESLRSRCFRFWSFFATCACSYRDSSTCEELQSGGISETGHNRERGAIIWMDYAIREKKWRLQIPILSFTSNSAVKYLIVILSVIALSLYFYTIFSRLKLNFKIELNLYIKICNLIFLYNTHTRTRHALMN